MSEEAQSLDLLTYKEAAKVLRVSERTMHTLAHTQRAIPVVKIGCKRFITRGDVFEFIRKSRDTVEAVGGRAPMTV
jgi:excisionase family DNA binding protein